MVNSKVAGGTDFVRSTLKAFVPATMQTVMMIDLLTYDAFPALAALEDIISYKYVTLCDYWFKRNSLSLVGSCGTSDPVHQPASGGGWRQAHHVRLCGAEWWPRNAAESHCQCGLWCLQGRECCASKLSLIRPGHPISTGQWSIHQWCELQSVRFQAQLLGGPSKFCTSMDWIWGHQGRCQPTYQGTQWKIQRWWWLHGRWWKDWCSKLEWTRFDFILTNITMALNGYN